MAYLTTAKKAEIVNSAAVRTTDKDTVAKVLDEVAVAYLMPAIPDLAGGADLATTVTKVNAILAALRTAGLLAT